ncbi:uncharacterized protein LOC142178148 [Nicotiana tabacum]|uniref:Uncharacterized protein LOC142178148 n=1 Tax=Nicotiana tabacum TaxID=4097 RepID=A0AC58U263_TOBAC
MGGRQQLLIYQAVSKVAKNVVLVQEEEGMQFPIYYISKVLLGAETSYPHLEKLALALVVASQKLRPYFQCYPISVVTTFPLRNVLYKPELSGHLAKWTVKVSKFDIEYKPRIAIKSQVFADFMADFSLGLMPLAAKEAVLVSGTTSGVWTLFTDGASNVKGSDLGVVLIMPSGEILRHAIRTVPLTNNEDEYEALVIGLELDRGLGSEYLNKLQALLAQFREWSIVHIPTKKNVEADALANLGSSTEMKGSDSGTVVQLLHLVLDVDGRKGIRTKVQQMSASCIVGASTSGTLHSVVSPWRFMKWGMDIVGPLPPGPGKLEDAKGKWPYELPGVLCAYWTTTKSSTGEIPFSLVYGLEALIPVEVGEPTLRFSRANEEANNEAFLVKLDLLEEQWDLAYVTMVAQMQRMERYYNRRANVRYFKVGDLVHRKVTRSTQEVNNGKLGQIWEGPYRVSVVIGKGSFELKNQDGVKLPRN